MWFWLKCFFLTSISSIRQTCKEQRERTQSRRALLDSLGFTFHPDGTATREAWACQVKVQYAKEKMTMEVIFGTEREEHTFGPKPTFRQVNDQIEMICSRLRQKVPERPYSLVKPLENHHG